MTPDPPLAEPFAWDGEHIAVKAPGGEALFTTRRGGVGARPHEDSLDLTPWTGSWVAERNMELVAEQIGIEVGRWAQGHQVHEQRVHRVRGAEGLASARGDYDGQATDTARVACVVVTADCLPVALLAEGAVAMVHAGWRGLAGGVLEEGVRAVRELGATGDIVAAIGPGAGGCCYEVGPEVREAFGLDGGGGPALLDLKAIASERLLAAGVTAVHDSRLCTLCSDPALFFSHRRDGGVTGRQAGIAWRT